MEIEVKARLKDKNAVMRKLADLGCVFSKPKTQDDMVYAEKTGSLETFLSNDVFLRIRIQDGSKVIFTVKKPAQKSNEMLVKYEHEVVVDSAEELKGALSLMGFSEVVRTKKMRQTAHYGDYEICIDEIEGLGAFIELEQMAAKEGAEEIQKRMFEFLLTLGVEKEDQVKKGYDILMIESSRTKVDSM